MLGYRFGFVKTVEALISVGEILVCVLVFGSMRIDSLELASALSCWPIVW